MQVIQSQLLTKMAPSNKHSSLERRKFICFQCTGDMSVEKAFEINQQSSERKEKTDELEDLQRDVVELPSSGTDKKVFSERGYTIGNYLISAKVDSLKDQTAVNIDSVMTWSDVLAGRKKASYTLQNKPCRIPVINNRYDLLSLKDVVEK